MALDEYRRKRDFNRTPEPKGKKRSTSSGRLFIVQKHRSRLLHYDFRLELDGVLLSWALPKGPSLDPSQKRLAVHTEDHPIEYGDFEGIIPEGEYGGGTVMLWDQGEWKSTGSAKAAYRQGRLKFRLTGEKLRGDWALVRMEGKAGDGGKNWLLIKENDDHARSEKHYCIVDEEPFSIVTQRSMQQIAQDRDRVWTDGGAVEPQALSAESGVGDDESEHAFDMTELSAARKMKQPDTLTPRKPATVKSVPDDDEWLHEIAFKGHRLLSFVESDRVTLRSATGEDWTRRLPDLARAVASIPVSQVILDGVVTVLDVNGVSSPGALDDALASRNMDRITYHLFDIPFLAGHDSRKVPLIRRKKILADLLNRTTDPSEQLQYSDHIQGNGAAVYDQAVRLGAPGLVSKRADSAYSGKRSRDWVRVPCVTDSRPNAQEKDPKKQTGVVVEPGFDLQGVRITRPNRMLYPDQLITKYTLVRFYERVADWILPHIADRPLSLYRCPQGFEKECFFQKHLNEAAPKHLRGVVLPDEDEEYITLDSVAGLLTLVQWNVLEIHPWGGRIDSIEKPDRLVFDLDPGTGVLWPQLVEGARLVFDVLEELGLQSFVKTSGGKGLHVVVPVARRLDWDGLKDFARAVSEEIVRRAPGLYLATMTKSKRAGKIFIDFFRNHRGATSVAPYSTRAKLGAPVSTPIGWDELDGVQPVAYNVDSLLRRLATLRHDPWHGFFECRQSITKSMKAKLGLPS
ncbi:MAG: non-homologous end-joining DNA ligase [Phycisphaerales bacterium]|nr:non-homologous end-joining DNA ligase [Phycisphaerales bacterium]